jgi:predicted Fe-Mo cluster-binding NifX family protein
MQCNPLQTRFWKRSSSKNPKCSESNTAGGENPGNRPFQRPPSRKEVIEIRIAVASDGDKVSLHFGKCPEYRVFHIEEGKVLKQETLKNPGHEPGVLPKFLANHGINCIIAGGMGPRAENLFTSYNVKVIKGALGSVDDVVESYLAGTLKTGESSCEHDK